MNGSAALLDDESLRSISVPQMDSDFMVARRLAVRRRFLLGLKDAFEALPELSGIVCGFGPNHHKAPTRSFLNDLISPDPTLQKKLDKALQPMRTALGGTRDSFDTVATLFSGHDRLITSEFLDFHWNHLLGEKIFNITTEEFSELDTQLINAMTAPARRQAPGRLRL